MAEAADELNTYQYAGNNPISFNDPLGDMPGFTFYEFRMPMLRQRIDPGPPGALPDYIPYGLHDSQNAYRDMAADQAFEAFVNSSGNRYSNDNDLLRAAQSGDPNAVAEYARRYGTTISLSSDPATRAAQLQGIANGQFNGNTFTYNYVSQGHDAPDPVLNPNGYDPVYHSVTKTIGQNGNQGSNESNGKLFDISGMLDKALNLTANMVAISQSAAGIGWKHMVREIPILKQLGTATGIVGFVDHGISFYKNPNWKDGSEMAGQLGIWGLKIAFPESSVIDAVEFGYNNGTMIFDTIWEHNHK